MKNEILFLLICLEISVLTYFTVWTVHYTDVFYTVRAWSQKSKTFIQRAVGCPVCFTYHVSLFLTSMVALIKDWSLVTWAIASGLVCFGALFMNSRDVLRLYYPDEED